MNSQWFDRTHQNIMNVNADQLCAIFNNKLGAQCRVEESTFQAIENRDRQIGGKNRSFDNQDNFYLKVLALLSDFLKDKSSSIHSFLYERMKLGCSDIPNFQWGIYEEKKRQSKLSHFLTRFEMWRRRSDELKIMLYLFVQNRKDLIEAYLKLRQRIISLTGGQKIAHGNLYISNHNIVKTLKKFDENLENRYLPTEKWISIVDQVILPLVPPIKLEMIIDYVRIISANKFQHLLEIPANRFIIICLSMLMTQPSQHHIVIQDTSYGFVTQAMFQTPIKKIDQTLASLKTQAHKLKESRETVVSHSVEELSLHRLDSNTRYDYTYKLKKEEDPQKPQQTSRMLKSLSSHREKQSPLDQVMNRIRKQMKNRS